MDGIGALAEPEASWSENTTPGSDDIEEIVRQSTPTLQRPFVYRQSGARSLRPPTRRRLRPDEYRDKSYQTFEITSMNSSTTMPCADPSSTTVMTIVTSATSSDADPWSSTGYAEEVDEVEDTEYNWDAQEDFADAEDFVVPKIEPKEDVDMADLVQMTDIAGPDSSASSSSQPPVQTKRPRGRPRKHPKPTAESLAKIAKGRSKTGCITCRKRKKKCDETKPTCMNCEKNSVTCEGYPEKTLWKSGKEKAEEARIRRTGSFALPNIQLPAIILGVETEGDRMFFQHYINRLSGIFTVEGETESAFRKIILPVAQHDIGLMHSILSLSGKHINYSSSYGQQLLLEHPDVDIESLEKRSQFHHEAAVKELTAKTTLHDKKLTAVYCQILCFVLETLSNPTPNGEHRFHLKHFQMLIKESPPENEEFRKFIDEFFQYHICADDLISLPKARDNTLETPDWNLPPTVLQPAAVRLLGVFDGLFLYMSKITNIRNKIRQNLEERIDPVVDYSSLYQAAEIDAGIREWVPPWAEADSRDLPGKLYKHMIWVYLFRTIYPPRSTNWQPDPRIIQAVNDGIILLGLFGPRDPNQTLILAPAFVIGCAAFEEAQRAPIRKAIGVVKAYTEYKNSDLALKVLEEVWKLMDAKDERSWDWQSIAHQMGMDFLAT